MKRKLLSVVSLALAILMSFTACSVLPQLSSSSAPQYEENLSFASVEEMVEYAGSHRSTDPRFHSIMDDEGKMVVYELRYMPKGYKLRDISLEGSVLTFTYLPDDENEREAITAMWNLSAVGNGRAMLREFIKDHKDLERAGKNLDIFYIRTEKSDDRVTGRNVYFEQADIMFTLFMPKKNFNNLCKKRSRLVNPMDVNYYWYEDAGAVDE